jgi:hypothetical protein
MCIARLIWAFVLAVSLAGLPVVAAMATAHAAQAGMSASASGDDCPCCKPDKPDTCPLKCCHLQALAVEGLVFAKPMSERLVAHEANAGIAVTLRPDPPPPRS